MVAQEVSPTLLSSLLPETATEEVQDHLEAGYFFFIVSYFDNVIIMKRKS
jgi:hypothetical protein